jgi:hypothetical protein
MLVLCYKHVPVTNPKSDRICIETLVRNIQILRIALHEIQVRPQKSPGVSARFTDFEHTRIDIENRHVSLLTAVLRLERVEKPERYISRSARDIQQPSSKPRIQPRHKLIFPDPMDSCRHEIVH